MKSKAEPSTGKWRSMHVFPVAAGRTAGPLAAGVQTAGGVQPMIAALVEKSGMSSWSAPDWQVALPAGGWPKAGLRCCSSSGVRFMRAPRRTTGSPTSPIRRPGPAEATGPSVCMPRWTGARNRSSRRLAPGSAEPRCSMRRCSSGLSAHELDEVPRRRASDRRLARRLCRLRALLRRRRGAAGGLRRAGPARRGSRRRRRCGRRRRSRPETRR